MILVKKTPKSWYKNAIGMVFQGIKKNRTLYQLLVVKVFILNQERNESI